MKNFKAFFYMYIQTALWSSTDLDADDSFLDEDYTEADMSKACYDQMEADCKTFLEKARHLLKDDSEELAQAGHDFWLTRNGHGAGFWDGDWKDYGDELTRISDGFKGVDLYTGDDGLIYQS